MPLMQNAVDPGLRNLASRK